MNFNIYNILKLTTFAVLVLLLWFILLLIIRSFINSKMDSKYGIQTTGLRDWDKDGLYNRTESTPYQALLDFSRVYQAPPGSHLVDFGAGKGRVTIFLHEKLSIPVTGIEINDLTYEEAERNISKYLRGHSVGGNITLVKEYAEKYVIKNEENIFFFFNPFSSGIFNKVLDNIINNSESLNKNVEIVLYYPMKDYKSILLERGFTLDKVIKTSKSIGFNEKFIIYKYIPKDIHKEVI